MNIRIASGPDQQQTATHHHHHHHHHHLHHNHSGGSDDDLPGYMRRPICAACNRNVKVTSSTESAAHLKLSASNSTNNSRRSSISASSTTAASAVALATATATTTGHMTKSKSAVSSSSTEGDIKTALVTTNEDNSATFKLNATRSHSPTSPIPTTQRIGERKRSILQDLSLKTSQLEDEDEDNAEKEKAVVSIHSNQKRQCGVSNNSNSSNSSKINVINEDRWSVLLNQQKRLLEFINRDSAALSSSAALHSDKQIDETNILETQMELLKRFEAFLMLTTVPITIATTPATPPSIITTQTTKEPTIESAPLPVTTWQTKVEFSITKFKWNMSQWFGTVVGTGNIEEQDFDALGYTKNVVISGVCVTTEPGLLPKVKNEVMIDILERPW